MDGDVGCEAVLCFPGEKGFRGNTISLGSGFSMAVQTYKLECGHK